MPKSAQPHRISLENPAATRRLAEATARIARPGDAILLEGELGAGKTELARAFLRAATGDTALEVPSPTFTLVQTYNTRLGPVHHFDMWRLQGPQGLEELAWDDARADIVLVEWPDRLGHLPPPDGLTIRLLLREGDAREAEVTGWQARMPALLAELANHPVSLATQAMSAPPCSVSPTQPRAEGEREGAIMSFLVRHGYSIANAEPLAQDASLRRYLRLTGGPRPAILMDAPASESVGTFLRVAAHLRAIGLSVPDILAADPVAGLVLQEDFGDALFGVITNANNQDLLFDVAVDTLIAVQRAAPLPGAPDWGPDEMRDAAMGTLFDWWWPAAFQAPAPAAARSDVAEALEVMLRPLDSGPRCLVHRDWFAGNLLWLPERTGVRRVGIIDFQGAALGHPAYDLMSLLQDGRRDIPPELEQRTLARYLARRPELDPAGFRHAYDVCAAQRHLRVACQWVRLAVRDHRPTYLAFGPRTWHLLSVALTRPAAAPLAAALDRWIPATARRNPPVPG